MLMIQYSVEHGKNPFKTYAIMHNTQYTWSTATALIANGMLRMRRNGRRLLRMRKMEAGSNRQVHAMTMPT